MSFERLEFVCVSDQERQSVSLQKFFFPKKNESKNLVEKCNESKNVTRDRDLAVRNTSKCEEEKTKGENGKNSAINLTAETN